MNQFVYGWFMSNNESQIHVPAALLVYFFKSAAVLCYSLLIQLSKSVDIHSSSVVVCNVSVQVYC